MRKFLLLTLFAIFFPVFGADAITLTYQCLDGTEYTDVIDDNLTTTTVQQHCTSGIYNDGYYRSGDIYYIQWGNEILTEMQPGKFTTFDCRNRGVTYDVPWGENVPEYSICDISNTRRTFWIPDDVDVCFWQHDMDGIIMAGYISPGERLNSYTDTYYNLWVEYNSDTVLDFAGGVARIAQNGQVSMLNNNSNLIYTEGCGYNLFIPITLMLAHYNTPNIWWVPITFTNGDARLVGWSTYPDGKDENGNDVYVIYFNDNNDDGIYTEEELVVDTSILLPTHEKLYAVWNGNAKPIPHLSINIDWGDGMIANLMGDGAIVSGLWSLSDALGASQSDLAEMVGVDIWEPMMDSYGNDIITACQSGDGMCMNPGHTLVGFSTSPDGMVENPTCIFPECNTFYAIWEPREPGTYLPGVTLYLNGGTLTSNGITFPYVPLIEDDNSDLSSLDGADLWTAIGIESFQEELLNIAQNPTDEISLTRDGYTFVGISADPNTPGVTTCIYPACNTFYAIWALLVEQCPIMKNIVLGNGTKIPLIKREADSELSHPAIVVRRGNQMCYANMAPDAKSGTLNIKYKDKVYHAE